MSLLTSTGHSFMRPLCTPARYYATKVSGADAASSAKLEVIRKTVWPPNIRARPQPNGTWRPDVGQALQFAIPSVQAHETIERAWKLWERIVRKRRHDETNRKFECMRQAMDKLAEIDPHRFTEANQSENPRSRSPEERAMLREMNPAEQRAAQARIRGLFPREMKAPSDTPSRDGWNYNYNPFKRII